MRLIYVRHGDPIYEPNTLTELGKKQANALVDFLSSFQIDKIYCSPSERAKMTAKPTSFALDLPLNFLPWADEDNFWKYFSVPLDTGGRTWIFHSKKHRYLLCKKEVTSMMDEWCKHQYFKDTNCQQGVEYTNKNVDEFLFELGFKHDRENKCFYALNHSGKTIALFAHEGAGKAIISSILDIPYNVFSTRFEFNHSGVTVIEFDESKEVIYPQIMTFSNNSHLLKNNIPTTYRK